VTQSPGEFKPSRRDVLRPVEYVGGAAIAAIFTGAIVLMVTRDWPLSLVFTGAAFIAVLVVLALLAMTIKPDAAESAELDEFGTPRGPDDEPRSPDGPAGGGH
jgi:predicted lysophospholipase L1 biosynthesis ABC-type transport system permease subunit